VQVVGRTADDVRGEIARRLSERYLRNPDVTVAVTESTNNNVTVEGGVRRPGQFPLTGQTSLLQAVALAGGIDPENGNDRRVAIFRRVSGQRMAAAFDLRSIRSGTMEDPEIYRGDIVVVQSNSRRGLFQDILSALPLIALFRPF
jgi:polysaccharide export outer membrane protein